MASLLSAQNFFGTDPVTCARRLLGCTLSNGSAAGVIVETEAYSTVNDPACHTAFLRKSREFVERNDAGTIYIHLNYGIHHLFNVLTKTVDGEAGFVLVRALDPTNEIEEMMERRKRSRIKDLCSGPGKLTVALNIGPKQHGKMLNETHSTITLPMDQQNADTADILVGTRIGISKAAHYPWRFGYPSPHLSRKF